MWTRPTIETQPPVGGVAGVVEAGGVVVVAGAAAGAAAGTVVGVGAGAVAGAEAIATRTSSCLSESYATTTPISSNYFRRHDDAHFGCKLS